MTTATQGLSRVGRWSEVVLSLGALAACTWLVVRETSPDSGEFLVSRGERALVYGAMALLIVGLLIAARWLTTRREAAGRSGGGWTFRLLGLIGTMALSLLVWERREQASFNVPWPPAAAASLSTHLNDLTPAERAEWGARVALHRVTTHALELVPRIPSDWEYPDDVRVAVTRLADGGVRLWTKASGGAVRCVWTPATNEVAACKSGLEPPDSAFRRADRVEPDSVSSAVLPVVGEAWPQYRKDANKSATIGGDADATPWNARLDGEIRSSIAVIGEAAIVGAHMTGALSAFDLRTGALRWTVRLPNWVHQDVVSDGRIVVAGFGNQWPSFAGRAPSGVSAFAVATGRHLWTQFDETSVMTSPVVSDTILTYGDAAGVVRQRSLRSGALIRQRQLPGGVIMAPPASVGDTIVFSLDHDGVCALLISSLDQIWCRQLPFHRMTGHAAPSIARGTVVTNSTLLLRGLRWREFLSLPWATQRRYLWSIVQPSVEQVGQRAQAFRLRDGAPLWSTRAFPALRSVDGHSSGTAAILDSIGVMAMPIADSLVAIDVQSGRVRWAVGAHGSRGPPLLTSGHVINAGRDGTIEVLDLQTGAVTCRARRADGFDRGGPAMVGDRLLLGSLRGTVEAASASALLTCSGADMTPATPATQASR